MTIARRGILLAGLGALAAVPQPAPAEGLPRLEVWRDPNCGCCGGWIAHMRDAGFAVADNLVASPATARRLLGIPADLLSCHAARVGSYAIEGHVPAVAVKRLLADRPAGIIGLAVPAMPIGSPGMEVPGQPPETYDVVAFDGGGGRFRFMRFRGAEAA